MRLEPIASLLAEPRRGPMRFVGGAILSPLHRDLPPLPDELEDLDAAARALLASAVIARVDLEETAPYSRPLLRRLDLARDFVLADESGRAIVHTGEAGRAHPDLELRLDGPFSTHALPTDEPEVTRIATVRLLRTGDPVYALGRPTLESDPALSTGYRDSALSIAFGPAPLCLFDEPAVRQLTAWQALPWYRKLSVIVRNR